MTRAEWYASHHGGGWRVARTSKRCDHYDKDGMRCTNLIQRGARYFDTNTRNHRSSHVCAKINLCAGCANEELK